MDGGVVSTLSATVEGPVVGVVASAVVGFEL